MRSAEVMKEILFLSKSNAYADAKKLGIDIDITEANNIQVEVRSKLNKNSDLEEDEDICAEDVDDVNEDLLPDKCHATEKYNFEERQRIVENDIEEDYNENYDGDEDYNKHCDEGKDSEKNYDGDEDSEENNDEGEDTKNNYRDEGNSCTCNHDLEDAIENVQENCLQNKTLTLQSNFKLPVIASKFVKTNKICKNCPYTYVRTKSGNRVLVWKSSLVWILNQGPGRISSDRLTRVRGPKPIAGGYDLCPIDEIEELIVCNEICFGDWCIFCNQHDPNTISAGSILQFAKRVGNGKKLGKKSNKKPWKQLNCGKVIIDEDNDKNSKEAISKGVYALWLGIDLKRKCLDIDHYDIETHGYVDVSLYVAHIPPPTLSEEGDGSKKTLILSDEIWK